jgi:hypothetical protein
MEEEHCIVIVTYVVVCDEAEIVTYGGVYKIKHFHSNCLQQLSYRAYTLRRTHSTVFPRGSYLSQDCA